MAEASVLVELWKGGGGWLVCAGIAWMLLHRFGASIVAYINAKATRERHMTEAVDKVLSWPDQFGQRLDNIERRQEEHTEAINHLATVIPFYIPPQKPKAPRTKETPLHE